MSSSSKKAKGEEDGVQGAAAAKEHEIDAIFAQRRKNKQQPEGSENGQETLGDNNNRPIGNLKHVAASSNKDAAQAKAAAVKKKISKKPRKDKQESRARSAEGKEPSLKSQKTTQEGYRVYTEEELAWNKRDAGGTVLCPFDCSCCF
ncbi:hypothetical protein O6H91_22G013400 [Diphasiastrum complanatum]|uniref:Uncharacterized protein n=1 Tax=Diphasiastrum complanatum TaxID=34168 RepID=A0ACC2AD35_DIPCM|nr:hypothetical protein O6H91_22G013400 [Diphasiastrum complanatum]